MTGSLESRLRAAVRAYLAEGHTQRELAAAAGWAQPHLSSWLNAHRSADLTTLERLAAAIGVRLWVTPGE